MSYDIKKLSYNSPLNSILESGNDLAEDYNTPFSYTEWLKRTLNNDITTNDLSSDYNVYVKKWTQYKSNSKTNLNTKERYRNLLKNIALNYTTTEEKRFLSNLDYKNPRHVETATNFIAKKLKQVSLYYSDARQHIRQLTTSGVTIGTPLSLKRYIYGELTRLIDAKEILGNRLRPGKIDVTSNKTVVSVVESYDVGGDSKLQKIEIVPEVFLDMEQAIQDVLTECMPVLQITDELSFGVSGSVEVSEENITLLTHENFINYIKSDENLNIRYIEKYTKDNATTTVYTLSGDEIKLFEPTYSSRKVFETNIDPVIVNYPTGNYRTKYQLGNMHVPQNMSMLTYYGDVTNFDRISDIEDINIRNPNQYGTRGVIDPITDVTWIKADTSNGNLAGDIIDSNRLQKFYSYRSDDEIKYASNTGISRASDPTGFFSGDRNTTWSNSDVFSKPNSNTYMIDERQDTLLVGHQRVVKWVSDIYGNEYALLKNAPPVQPLEQEPGSQDEYVTSAVCQIIDGGETLKPRPELWSDGVQYKIYEGGRRWQYDPKVEQQQNYTPFEDLRQVVTVVTSDGTLEQKLEEHNTFDLYANPARNGLEIQPITYHGFVKNNYSPVYDQQAYCGLFTDLTCGQIDPGQRECIVRDNYAFNTFSDVLSTTSTGEQYYVSTGVPAVSTQDAFELYFNDGYDHLDFTNTPLLTSTTVFVSENADGSSFSEVSCLEEQGEFVYATDQTSKYYDNVLNVSRTKYKEDVDNTTTEKTTYEEQSNNSGRAVFRSYNSSVIDDIDNVVDQLLSINAVGRGMEYKEFVEQVSSNQIVDMDVYYDVLMIQTLDYVFAEKINFNPDTCKIERSEYPGVLETTKAPGNKRNEQLQTTIKPYYNKYTNDLIFGHTNNVTVSGVETVLPVIYKVNLNTMISHTIHPTNTRDTSEQFVLTDVLSGYIYENVDQPIVSYNEIVDMYTLSYSCLLSGGENVCKGICVIDFENDNSEFELKSVEMHHGEPVARYIDNRPPWEEKSIYKKIRFDPETMQPPVDEDVTYNYSFSAIDGEAYKGYRLDLEMETFELPVPPNTYKINKIIFDPDDGTAPVEVVRELTTGLEPLDFDISDLPDQSDFADPRIQPIIHEYKFTDANRTAYTPSLTAVYSHYKKLVINLTLEVEPYTLQSAFEDVKLIDTKTFSDPRGVNKQLFVLETQNPRYISHNTITKEIYSNSSVVGYLDGAQYAGDYHVMSDGTIMTGAVHTPESRLLTSSPTSQPTSLTQSNYSTTVDLQANNYKYT